MAGRPLQVIGAGLPRTGTASLKAALEMLLDAPCYHMSVIPGHPFDLGPDWRTAIAGGQARWSEMTPGCAAAIDWPASLFWKELLSAHPDALVILTSRPTAQEWLDSLEATVLRATRAMLEPGWTEGRDLDGLFRRFTGTPEWNDPATLLRSYERHNAEVRACAPARFLDFEPAAGWGPLCSALGVPEPEQAYPWVNRRQEWFGEGA